MNLEHYSIIADNSHLIYEFESIGPKGIIRKSVQYTRIIGRVNNLYNLSFGDLNDLNKSLNDKTVSNNNDFIKVLLTVAHTTLEFMRYFPDAYILIVGSTKSRTRLYQMMISHYIVAIRKLSVIEAYKDGMWSEFKSGINFDAFLVSSRKKNR